MVLPRCWLFDSSWSWKTKLLSTFEALLMTCTPFKLKNEIFKDDIHENNFLPCLWVSALSSNSSSKFQTDDRVKIGRVTFTSGILAAQQDSLCFQCKHTFYILAHYSDLQLQIFTHHSRISNMTAPIPQVIFPPPLFMLAIYFGSSF